MKHLSAWMVMSALAVAGCRADETKVDTDGIEPPASWNAIPDGNPKGRIHSADFEAKDARLYIKDQPGRRWVTISLSAATAAEPCGAREPSDAPSVWIRLPGKVGEALAVRELTRAAADAEQPAWEVHYQLPQEGAPWIGHGHAAARFAIRRYVPGFGIDGELAVCFADGLGSCVMGSFKARECPNPLSPDVREIAPAAPMPARPTASASASASAPASASASTPSTTASAAEGAH